MSSSHVGPKKPSTPHSDGVVAARNRMPRINQVDRSRAGTPCGSWPTIAVEGCQRTLSIYKLTPASSFAIQAGWSWWWLTLPILWLKFGKLVRTTFARSETSWPSKSHTGSGSTNTMVMISTNLHSRTKNEIVERIGECRSELYSIQAGWSEKRRRRSAKRAK